jgi:hypothetical protein
VAATVRVDPVAQAVVAQVAADRVDRVVPGRAGPAAMDPADPDPAVPVDLVTTDPVDLEDLVTTDRAGRAAQVTTDLADPATTDLAGRADPVTTDPAGRVGLADHGTAMTTAATSTTLHGAMDPHPGVPASRRVPTGAGRCRRPVDDGTTARSTTTATRKHRPGTRSSISSASTSSEFGSRCKDSPHQTPASPTRRSGRCPFRMWTFSGLLWPNGDVAVGPVCPRRDRWSGAFRRHARQPRVTGTSHRTGIRH